MADDLRGKKLGTIFVALGVLDSDQEKAALENAKTWGVPFGRACVKMGFFEDDTVVQGLSIQLGVPSVSLAGLELPDSVRTLLSREMAEKHRVVPVGVTPGAGRKGTLLLALSSPKKSPVMDELAFATGHKIAPVIASDTDIDAALLRLYGVEVDRHSRASTMVDLDIDDGIAAGAPFELDLDRDAASHVTDFLPSIDLEKKPQ